MSWDQLESNWARYTGSFRQRFEQLTDEEVKNLSGKKADLIGKIESAYRYSRDEAKTHVEKWRNSVPDDLEHVPTSTSGAPTY